MSGLRWPRFSLVGQTVLVLLASVVLLQVAGLLVSRASMTETARAVDEDYAAQLIAAGTRVLDTVAAPERAAASQALSRKGLELRWLDRAPAQPASDPTHFGTHLASLLPAAVVQGPVAIDEVARVTQGHVPLASGGVLAFRIDFAAFHPPGTPLVLIYTTSLAALVAAGAGWLVHGLGRPLRRVAQAADAAGPNSPATIAEDGPSEVRRVARAFNRMQSRIHRLVEDRTMALAAVSHDLRTPMTRIRLDIEALAEPAVRSRIDAALDEMDAMIDTTLAYVQGDPESEPIRAVDLVALLQTLIEAAEDAGHDATFSGPRRSVVRTRVSALRRALGNLVNNAVRHGGSVHVTVHDVSGAVTIDIDDCGPGIPEADLERVFTPFLRLDAAGPPSHIEQRGGVGLGLTIARRAIEGTGGTLTLQNRPEGGLRARVVLAGALSLD